MLNLFILIVLDQYDMNYFQEDNPLNKFEEYSSIFMESWVKFSLNGEKIRASKLTDFILDLKKPLGMD